MEHLDLNFLALLPPEECARRLHIFAKAHTSLSVRTRATLQPVGGGSYVFRIERSFYSLPITRRYRGYRGMTVGRANYIKIRIEGHLTAWADSQSTLVMGQARLMPKTFIINGGILILVGLVVLALTVFFLRDFLCFAPVILVLLLAFAQTTLIQPEALGTRYKHALIRQIKQTLV
ncbi:MAG: hypothetical protein OHK0046_40630 [Anaerolineae bacterium]